MPTLSQAILLGAERLGAAAPTPPHPVLATSWAALDWANSPDTALLEAAALAGGVRRAAVRPVQLSAAPTPAAPESQPTAPAAAAGVLRRLLAEESRALLPEWLTLCAQRGALVPPFFLRGIFELRLEPAERALVRAVTGERGRWLARQNPAWAWIGAEAVAAAGGAELWETGAPEERLAWLRRQRATDPEAARTALGTTWVEEAPVFRVEALMLLATGLSAADEPFLTQALGDRRKEIRLAARRLLATLPRSGLAARMRARADGMLGIQRKLLGRKLEVSLPAAFDPAWREDGIEEKPPAGIGEKAFWTQQVLGLVPLAHWSAATGVEPAKLVELAAESGDWAELLLDAWFRAVTLHRESAAAAALVAVLPGRTKLAGPGANLAEMLGALLGICTERDCWRLAAQDAQFAWAALPWLAGAPAPAEGRALLRHVASALRDGYNPGGSPAAVLAARRVPPALRDEAAQLLERPNGLSKPAEAFLQALDLRAAMHAAFAP